MGLFKTFLAGRTVAAPAATDEFARLDAVSGNTEASTWTQMKDDVLTDVASQYVAIDTVVAGVVDVTDPTVAALAEDAGSDTTAALSARYGDSAWDALPNFARAISNQNDATPTTIRLIGLGSSVGAGANLTNAAVDAPSPYLAAALTTKLDVLGNIDITHTNGSVGGTTIADAVLFGDYGDAITAAGGTATLMLLSFGMNEGRPTNYHRDCTPSTTRRLMIETIKKVRYSGGDVIIATSPHPNSDTYDWTFDYAGLSATYPGSEIPDETTSIASIPWKGATIDVSYRHLRVNQIMREVAAELGVALIDAERHWFDAIAAGYTMTQLFGVSDTVHPNDLGHQVSYHAAIDDWVNGLAVRAMSNNNRPGSMTLTMRTAPAAVNNSTTAAPIDDLTFFLPPWTTAHITGSVVYNSATAADIQFVWSSTANLTGYWGLQGLGNTASGNATQSVFTAQTTFQPTNACALGGAGTGNALAQISAVFSTTAGTWVTLNYMQRIADVSDTTLQAAALTVAFETHANAF